MQSISKVSAFLVWALVAFLWAMKAPGGAASWRRWIAGSVLLGLTTHPADAVTCLEVFATTPDGDHVEPSGRDGAGQ